jgi:hypothetical protein
MAAAKSPAASLFFSHISELIRIIPEHSLAPEIGKYSSEPRATLRLDDQVPSSP